MSITGTPRLITIAESFRRRKDELSVFRYLSAILCSCLKGWLGGTG